MTDGQLGDFVIEIDKPFHDHFSGAGTSAFLCIVPGAVDIFFFTDNALSVSARAHDRLDDTWHSDNFDSLDKFFFCLGKTIRRGRQTQFLGSQTADAFAIHGQPGGTGCRDDMESFFFQFHQCLCRDGLHFGNDIIWFFFFYNLAQSISVQHRYDIRTVGDLHGRSICIFVQSDYFHSITL